ncbi:MAG: hypothetical protein KF901_29635 [Myxococcales bacterium]|nr:hypothetical protein [Myxococcales bacterium]
MDGNHHTKRHIHCGGLAFVGRVHVGLVAALLASMACATGPGASGEDRGGSADGGPDVPRTDDAGPSFGDGGGGEPEGDERCNGLDDDGDGWVDEGCPCDVGAMQRCYAAVSPPSAGCRWGAQVCGEEGWGACTDAAHPPPGEAVCCDAVEEDGAVEHRVYPRFVERYSAAAMPRSIVELNAFLPGLDGHSMEYRHVNPGNEFVDHRVGGLTDANIETGLAASRAAAVAAIPAGAEVISEVNGVPITERLGGEGGCFGFGFAWGSVVYRTAELSVHEIVYLYYGFCVMGIGDAEGFYYSALPATICEEPVIH